MLAATSAQAQPYFLVHLPSEPIEAANRQAAAVTALSSYLAAEVPGLPLEAKIFRRYQDAAAFLRDHGAGVALMLTEASFLLDIRDPDLVPSYRFVRGSRGTYRRLLVVKSDRPELTRLLDLSGHSLSVVETAGASSQEFLSQAIFVGEIDPSALFSSVDAVVDDFTATANVLYGQSDAALVAEFNPLVASHLGKDLRSVYASPPLSLPILAVRRSALDDAQRTALANALAGIAQSTAAQPVLAELGLDGFEGLAAGAADRAKLLGLGAEAPKAMELALPSRGLLAVAAPPLPQPSELPFTLSVELPEVPLIADEPGSR